MIMHTVILLGPLGICKKSGGVFTHSYTAVWMNAVTYEETAQISMLFRYGTAPLQDCLLQTESDFYPGSFKHSYRNDSRSNKNTSNLKVYRVICTLCLKPALG